MSSNMILVIDRVWILVMASIPGAAPQGGDRNRAAELIAIAWSQCAISIISVVLRFYSGSKKLMWLHTHHEV